MAAYDDLVPVVQAAIAKLQASKDTQAQLDAERAEHANTRAARDAANASLAQTELNLKALKDQLASMVG